ERIDVVQPHNHAHVLGTLANATTADAPAAFTATAAAPRWPAASTAGAACLPRAPTTSARSCSRTSVASSGSQMTTSRTSTSSPWGATCSSSMESPSCISSCPSVATTARLRVVESNKNRP
ncbi:MAG: hypothetical protein GEU97_19930, partial [Actinophytocola sp.]|nr:hypothetical protein [Actinophytocola sp.]